MVKHLTLVDLLTVREDVIFSIDWSALYPMLACFGALAVIFASCVISKKILDRMNQRHSIDLEAAAEQNSSTQCEIACSSWSTVDRLMPKLINHKTLPTNDNSGYSSSSSTEPQSLPTISPQSFPSLFPAITLKFISRLIPRRNKSEQLSLLESGLITQHDRQALNSVVSSMAFQGQSYDDSLFLDGDKVSSQVIDCIPSERVTPFKELITSFKDAVPRGISKRERAASWPQASIIYNNNGSNDSVSEYVSNSNREESWPQASIIYNDNGSVTLAIRPYNPVPVRSTTAFECKRLAQDCQTTVS